MKRKACLFVLAALCAISCLADTMRLTVAKGGSKTLEPGFLVEKYKVVGAKELVNVAVENGVALLTGMEEGTCAVRLFGPGNLEATVEVLVGGDILQVQRGLVQILEIAGVSGVEVTKVGNRLAVNGEISDPASWKQVKRVLAGAEYQEVVNDLTVFKVLPDTLKALRDQFKAEGFELTENVAAPDPGKVNIQYIPNTLIVSGTVFSPSDQQRILRILNTQSAWLWMEGYSQVSREDWQTIGRLNVTTDQQLLHMDVVLVGYSESDLAKSGNYGKGLQVSSAFSSFLDLVHGKLKNDTFRIDANLGDTLKFLRSQGLSRKSVGGYLRFKSNDSEPNRLKIGGTLKVRLQGATAEGNPTENMEDIEYGFIVEKKSAGLVSSDMVSVKLSIEQKNYAPLADGSYDVPEYTYNPVIDCPLGKTVVLGGYQEMVESTVPPSGFPILRHVPIVNWFVSNESNEKNDLKLMMLISVRAVKADEPEAQKTALPYEESKNLPTEVQVGNDERLEARKYHGILYFLNWFMP